MNEFEAELKARAFVKRVAPQSAPVPLEPYLEEVRARLLVDHSMSPDEAGYSMPVGPGFVIAVNGHDSLERQRFTICHEIGHIALGLPSEHSPSASAPQRRPINEVCCDIFAAELLLPVHLFQPAISDCAATFAALEALQQTFQASLHALASRYAALAQHPCAFLIVEGGCVQHCFRSSSMRGLNLWVRRGMRLPPTSKAARQGVGEPVEHSANVWLDGDVEGVVIEDAICQVNGVALLLLACECDPISGSETRRDKDRATYERDGLDELSGTLSWNRRR